VPQGIFRAELVANGGNTNKAQVHTASESSRWPAAGAGLPRTQALLMGRCCGCSDKLACKAVQTCGPRQRQVGPAVCSARGCYCLARPPPLLAAADALPGDHGASSEVQQTLGRCCVAAALRSGDWR
jgi:hypothetical protein